MIRKTLDELAMDAIHFGAATGRQNKSETQRMASAIRHLTRVITSVNLGGSAWTQDDESGLPHISHALGQIRLMISSLEDS